MRRIIPEINKIIKDPTIMTKVFIYMSTKSAGDDFDPFESNYTFTDLNPLAIKAYVREFTPETAFWKQYGLHQEGMKEILTETKYRAAFENSNKIVINDITYQVFKAGTGNKTMITERPYKVLRVIVSRLD